MCTWRLQCAETVRSDTHCICHVYRGPALLHKKSCTRTILLARLRSGHWWVEGGTCYYHHTRALQAPPPRARNNHLGWNDSCDSLFSQNHASFQPFPFVQPNLYRDVRSGILDFTTSTASHHLLASDGNISLHFPKLREQENLRALEQKQQSARVAAVQKKLEKLTPVEEFQECCSR